MCYPQSENTADYIPRGVIQGESRPAADDGVTDVEQAPDHRSGTFLSPSRCTPPLILTYKIIENISTLLQYPLPLPPLTPEDAIGTSPNTVPAEHELENVLGCLPSPHLVSAKTVLESGLVVP